MRYLLAFVAGAVFAAGVIALLAWWDDERSYRADVSRRVSEY